MSRSISVQQRIRESKIAQDNMKAAKPIASPVIEVISNIRSEANTKAEPITPPSIQGVPNPLQQVDIKKTKKNIATHYIDYKAMWRMVALEASMKEDKQVKAERLKNEKRKNKVEIKTESDTKRILRYQRSRFISHAGGMLDMTGFLRYTYSDNENTDNPQDNLRANLIVGALLELGDILSQKDTEELAALVARGSQFRNTDPDKRMISIVNPNLTTTESVMTNWEFEAYKFSKKKNSENPE